MVNPGIGAVDIKLFHIEVPAATESSAEGELLAGALWIAAKSPTGETVTEKPVTVARSPSP